MQHRLVPYIFDADGSDRSAHRRCLLATLLDWQVDSCYRVLKVLAETIDRLDDAALQEPPDRHFLDRLVTVRRRVATLRLLLTPHREVFAALARPDFEPVARTEAAPISAPSAHASSACWTRSSAHEMVTGSF